MFSDQNVFCDGCGVEFYLDDMYVVNDEFEDRRIECQDCHNFQMENREEIRCESCGEYFDMHHIDHSDRFVGESSLCPYCGDLLFEDDAY